MRGPTRHLGQKLSDVLTDTNAGESLRILSCKHQDKAETAGCIPLYQIVMACIYAKALSNLDLETRNESVNTHSSLSI